MDELLQKLCEENCGTSTCGLYLGGAAHANDVRAIASSVTTAETQGALISEFSFENGLRLNKGKMKIVEKLPIQTTLTMNNLESTISTLHQARWLGFLWSSTMSARPSIEHNINKTRKQFFVLGSTGYSWDTPTLSQ